MQPHHARRVAQLPRDAHDYLLHYFCGRASRVGERDWSPAVSLAEVGAGQADCVLALLYAGDAQFDEYAEYLVGQPIARCPPSRRLLAPFRWTEAPDERSPDRRRCTFVMGKNPRRGSTQAYARFKMWRVGMTVQQYMVRGGTQRDVRLALHQGWIRLEGADGR